MSVNLDRIGWQDGTLVSKAKVEVNGVIYDVEPEQYSGQTPLSSANLKKMEENTEKAINEVDTELNNEITNKGKWVKLATTTSTTAQTLTTESLSKFTAIVLQVTVSNDENRVLQSTTGSIDQFKLNANWQVGFASDSTNYFVNCSYVSDTSVNMRTNSQYDRGVLWGII